jgi:hypothetical protein
MQTYWNQFNIEEINSMHGIDEVEDEEDIHEDYEAEEDEGFEHSLYSLGMSWRDFI